MTNKTKTKRLARVSYTPFVPQVEQVLEGTHFLQNLRVLRADRMYHVSVGVNKPSPGVLDLTVTFTEGRWPVTKPAPHIDEEIPF